MNKTKSLKSCERGELKLSEVNWLPVSAVIMNLPSFSMRRWIKLIVDAKI